MSVVSPGTMKLQGFRVGRILDGEMVGVKPNPACENPSYTKSL